jgi:hypothetical protein
VEVDPGVTACIPRCERNSHCSSDAAPFCDAETGRCTDVDPDENNAGSLNNTPGNNGVAPTGGGQSDDGGCSVGPAGSAARVVWSALRR